MRLKPDASEVGIARDNLILRCGDCMHFGGTRSPLYDEPCSKRGVLNKSIAPNCYTPNIAVFKSLGAHFYQTLSILVANMRPSSVRVLAGVLKTAPTLARRGFSLFEKVYFAIGDPKYLSNYFSGYVISPGVSGEAILVAGSLSKSSRMVTASLHVSSVMTLNQFKEKRAALVAKGALVDPEMVRTKFKPKRGTKAEEYEPPTIDSVQDEPQIAKKLRRGVDNDTESGTTRLILDNKKMAPAHFTRGMAKRKGGSRGNAGRG